MDLVYSSWNITYKVAMDACLLGVQKAEELGIRINISVVDKSGLEVAFLRMSNAFIHSINIAKDKAYTSSSFGFPTSQWVEIFKESPHLAQSFSNMDRLIPFGGGFPITKDGEIIGAIGVSGGSEAEDVTCAKYALEKTEMLYK